MDKCSFIEEELIGNAIHGAFQRGRIYANSHDTENPRRIELYASLAKLLCVLGDRYQDIVSSEVHEANISELADTLTNQFSDILLRQRFRIGTAQKALNLYLKYMWCLNKIATPPHCPFDGVMIGKLTLNRDVQWTKMDDMEDYRALVNAAKAVSAPQYKSLAHWELDTYSE